MTGPCVFCADYPHHCAGLCSAKMAYINEVEEDIPVIRKENKLRENSFTYRNGKKYDINKNGIQREVVR